MKRNEKFIALIKIVMFFFLKDSYWKKNWLGIKSKRGQKTCQQPEWKEKAHIFMDHIWGPIQSLSASLLIKQLCTSMKISMHDASVPSSWTSTRQCHETRKIAEPKEYAKMIINTWIACRESTWEAERAREREREGVIEWWNDQELETKKRVEMMGLNSEAFGVYKGAGKTETCLWSSLGPTSSREKKYDLRKHRHIFLTSTQVNSQQRKFWKLLLLQYQRRFTFFRSFFFFFFLILIVREGSLLLLINYLLFLFIIAQKRF